MQEVTAEMIERGRTGDPAAAANRRRLALRMREAREKLTSSGSGQRTFDIELLRMFAQRQRAAAPAMGLLALVVAGVSAAWVPVLAVLAWLALIGPSILLQAAVVQRFLAQRSEQSDHFLWRRRFVLAQGINGVAWALSIASLMNTPDPAAQSFVLFMLLFVSATTALLSASVPPTVYAGLLPVTVAVLVVIHPTGALQSMPSIVLASGAQVFFVILARRLYTTTVETLLAQAEKDALIVELEQAKLNSDEARRRAEEASLAKSRFLATMSHELRTPLNAILGFSEVMKSELFGAHSVAAYREYSNDIHSSGQHLLMLINEILDLSRVEAGRYELKEEPIALAHVVEECQHLVNLRASKRGIQLVEVLEPALPRIWADERAIRQVVLNLLSNAIKFTPQGGSVTIKVGWTAQGGQYVSIRDTGPGIPEAEIPIVMSSFGRGTLAQKNAEEGSGLGLPIVKGLVELHGGSFTLRSKIREGTEVVVILPPERVIDALPHMSENGHPTSHRRRPAA